MEKRHDFNEPKESHQEDSRERKPVNLEDFEGPEYAEIKRRYDPLYKKLEELGINPDDCNFSIRAIISKEPKSEHPEKYTYKSSHFDNYHDYLKKRRLMTDNEKGALDGDYKESTGVKWKSPGFFANDTFWEDLKNPKHILGQNNEKIWEIIRASLGEQLPDDYVEAVKRGEIKNFREETEKLFGQRKEILQSFSSANNFDEIYKILRNLEVVELGIKDCENYIFTNGELAEIYAKNAFRFTYTSKIIENEIEVLREDLEYFRSMQSGGISLPHYFEDYPELWNRVQSLIFVETKPDQNDKKKHGDEEKQDNEHKGKKKRSFLDRFRKKKEDKREDKAEEKSEEKEISEINPEINEVREAYAQTYKEYKKTYGGMNKKELEAYKEAVKQVSEKTTPEGKEEFIKKLEEKGLRPMQTEMIYEMVFAKDGYEKAKSNLGKDLFGKKKVELEAVGKQGEELENELKKYKATEIFQKLIIDENDALAKAQMESWPPKEKGIFRKAVEQWAKIPKSIRWAASAAIATGLAVSGGYVAGGTAALAFAGYRFGRAALAGLTTIGAERLTALGIKGWESTIGKKKTKEYRVEELKEKFAEGNIVEEQSSEEYQKIIEEATKRTRRQNLFKWGVAAAAGGSSMLWGGALDNALGFGKPAIPVEGRGKPTVPEEESSTRPGEIGSEAPTKPGGPIPETAPRPSAAFETETMEIGSRGPEGEIIKSLESDPELAQQFGWDGVSDLDKWAGSEAHKLWLDYAHEALKNPETLKQLNDLGYSQDLEGYAKMMKRIGKGAIEIDPTSKKINLVDMDYLKAKPSVPAGVENAGAGKTGGPAIFEDIAGGDAANASGPRIFEDVDAQKVENVQNAVTLSKNIHNWLEKTVGLEIDKSSWLNEAFMKKATVGEILDRKFIGDRDWLTGAPKDLDYNEIWDVKEKIKLRDNLEKIIKQIPIENRQAAQKIPLYEFLSKMKWNK